MDAFGEHGLGAVGKWGIGGEFLYAMPNGAIDAVRGAVVLLMRRGRQVGSAITDRDGGFRFGGRFIGGKYRVRTRVNGILLESPDFTHIFDRSRPGDTADVNILVHRNQTKVVFSANYDLEQGPMIALPEGGLGMAFGGFNGLGDHGIASAADCARWWRNRRPGEPPTREIIAARRQWNAHPECQARRNAVAAAAARSFGGGLSGIIDSLKGAVADVPTPVLLGGAALAAWLFLRKKR